MIAQYQKEQTVTKLKKAYSTLSQTIIMARQDTAIPVEDWYEYTNYNTLEYYNLFFKKYIRTLKICDGWKDCGYNKSRPFVENTGKTAGLTLYDSVQTSRLYFYMDDGTFVIVNSVSGGIKLSSLYLIIDINGVNKPNKYGRDVFWFIFDNKKGLVSADAFSKKIMKDGWQIKDDYPW